MSGKGDINETMAALDRAAQLHEDGDRWEEALHVWRHMLDLNEKYQHGAYKVDLLDHIASILSKLGRSDEATQLRAEADSIQDYEDYLHRD